MSRSAPPPDASGGDAQFGIEVVATTGPAVRQALSVQPLGAGGTDHWPIGVELFANVWVTSGEPDARALTGTRTISMANTVPRQNDARRRRAVVRFGVPGWSVLVSCLN